MTVTTTKVKDSFVGDGVTADFAFTFPTQDSSWVSVWVDDVEVTATITLNLDQSTSPGGTATPLVVPGVGAVVEVVRTVPLTQGNRYSAYASFPSAVHEAALDKLTMSLQQLDAEGTGATDQLASDLAQEVVDRAAGDSAVQAATLAAVAALSGQAHTADSLSSVLAYGSTTPRTLTARFADVLNVLDFGAVGDGVTDDTDAIEAAIAAAPTVTLVELDTGIFKPSISSTIFFPTPSVAYRMTRQLTLPNTKSLRFQGEAATGPRLLLDSVDDYHFRLASGTARSVIFEGLWFDQGGIYYETNCRTYHRISECRFSRSPVYGINSAGTGVVNVRVDRCIFTNNVGGGININDEQSDLWSITQCSLGSNGGVDLRICTSGVVVQDCNFESKAIGAEAYPYIQVDRGTTLSPGLQIIIDSNRFGNEVAHPVSAIVLGPLGSVDDTHSTSPIWVTNNVFKGATGSVPSDTNAKNAILLNIGAKGLLVDGNSFWHFKNYVNEAAGATLNGSRGTYGNLWGRQTYMGAPTVAAFTAGAIGWTIDDPVLEIGYLPALHSDTPLPQNRFPTTEVTSWGLTANLTVTKNATGPDGVASSAFALARTAIGSCQAYADLSGVFPAGVASIDLWLKAGTEDSVRLAVLAGGAWKEVPDVPRKLSTEWRKVTLTVKGIGAADTVRFYIYVGDAADDAASNSGTVYLAFPNATDGAVPAPYVPALTAQHAARPFQSLVLGEKVIEYGTAAPAAGRHEVGDLCFNTAPTASGGGSPYVGWVCVTAGSPGTWKTFGAISA